jgi:hypothetical protein
MDRFVAGVAEAELARVNPNIYWRMKRTEMIFGGIICVTLLGVVVLAIFAGSKHTENQNLKTENRRLKEEDEERKRR